MRETSELLSCDAVALYGNGEIADPDFDLDRLVSIAGQFDGASEVLAEIFPSAEVLRGAPEALIGHDPDFLSSTRATFAQIDRDHGRVSPVLLVRIRDAIIWSNMLFVVAQGRVVPLYECYRPNDRSAKGERIVARLAACAERRTLDLEGRPGLFMGSAGSFNYGHWLVDDFPALACANALWPASAPARVLISRFAYGAIDAIREEGVRLALGPERSVEVDHLDPTVAYHVRNIHFATPPSYHPLTKHPASIAYTRAVIQRIVSEGNDRARPRKIFVNRAPNWFRHLVNVDDLRSVLAQAGYEEVFPEAMPLHEQWATFSAADGVVGIMGAAMAGSLLCPPGSRSGYLAASGWLEPFFWDLAAMAGHRYAAAFGRDDGVGDHLYQRSFSVDPDLLASLIKSMSARPPA